MQNNQSSHLVVGDVNKSVRDEVVSSDRAVVLLVDSVGGSVSDALVMREAIKSKQHHVIFVGQCSSSAMFLLGADPTEEILPTAFGKVHRPSVMKDDDRPHFPHHNGVAKLWRTIKSLGFQNHQFVDAEALKRISQAMRQVA